MMKPRHFLLLLLTGVLTATVLHAAEDSDGSTADTAVTEAEAADAASGTETESADIDAALAEEIRAAEAAQAAAAPGSSSETFVPTVQISEDLSVSFPVDI